MPAQKSNQSTNSSLLADGLIRSMKAALEIELDKTTEFVAGSTRLVEAIRYSLLAPGKRLRPLLVLLAAEAFQDGAWHDALPAAAAVECFHVFTLILDDLPAMDNDSVRRGQPSCHCRFGEAMAILAGNSLMAHSFDLLCRRIQDPDKALRCCLEFSSLARPDAMAGGQLEDLSFDPAVPLTAQEMEAVFLRKTGLLMGAAARIGGIVAGANSGVLNELGHFGETIGVAFQILDDLIDHRVDARESGSDSIMNYCLVSSPESTQARVDELTLSAMSGMENLNLARLPLLEAFVRLAIQKK